MFSGYDFGYLGYGEYVFFFYCFGVNLVEGGGLYLNCVGGCGGVGGYLFSGDVDYFGLVLVVEVG